MGLLCVCRLCGNTILSPNGTQLFYVLTDYTAFHGEHLGKAAVIGQASWSQPLVNQFLVFSWFPNNLERISPISAPYIAKIAIAKFHLHGLSNKYSIFRVVNTYIMVAISLTVTFFYFIKFFVLSFHGCVLVSTFPLCALSCASR